MMRPKERAADKYAALAVPAIQINHFFLAGMDGGIRFVVGEKFDNEPTTYHAAFNMPVTSVLELVNVLSRMLATKNLMPAKDTIQ